VVNSALSMHKKETQKPLANFSEADLHGHLQNTTHISSKSTATIKADEKALLYDDYQLYAALTILKSLALAKH